MIEINGVQYEEIPKEPVKKTSRALDIIAPYILFGMMGAVGSSKPKKELPVYDVVSEYKLILEKKSKLSKSQRDQVVHYFNRHFRKVES